MIYGKLWCVVKPSVGIPLFIAAVAVSSFSVHLALATNTTWVKAFLNGGAGKAVATASAAAAPEAAVVKK
ncbi:MAG: light-harvesting protein [Rhodoferax sp.]|nr:light-harvesting protein [Rhodoferax sp.]